MNRALLAITTVFALVFSSQTAAVSNWRFMQDGFLYGLSETDAMDFKRAVRAALEASPDEQVLTWRSDDGQRIGKVYPKFTYESRGVMCRRTLFALEKQGGRKEYHRLDICKQGGSWGVVDAPDPMSKSDQEQSTALLRTALDEHETGDPVVWVSNETGLSATIVLLDGLLGVDPGCRSAAITLLDTEGRSMSGRYRFCRDASGDWNYSPEAARAS